MTSPPIEAQKNILGYTLKQRIGSGGFGEVWSAIAPGGLLKAIKIVYGFHDEKRAQAEMKALDRVKTLRHPFLLSLERIEIFEGQLVVVTELADNSLTEVFNEFVGKGELGIPREKLLKYIKCAADALDYLSDEHSLQHLDVKPENLLMVSGHVKVADFGLIKDVQNASQSLMSGMTPAYAAPELFDGRPGTKSDQYSLAIVYQEMLTGIRPFSGNTPAQLAAQHMHGKPNLRPLPPGDQPIIAKALSKDPNVRYGSCQEMVEELLNKKRLVKKAIRRIQPARARQDSDPNTLVCKANNQGGTSVLSDVVSPFQAAEHKSLDPPVCAAADAKLRPTLIVTLGETANRVAKKIKNRIVSRHGSTDNVPSVSLLCLDTDRKALNELRMETGPGALTSDEILDIPLRKPEDYRERSKAHLSWLSHRWIYNVPRSLKTEGLRPLGRLAFADHFEAICDRVQMEIKKITAVENLAKSADTLDIDPGDLQPRIYVLTSISGGTGSGMALDLAYTIKLLLHENGMKSDSVCGLMLHSTYQRMRDPGLSSANAFAFLTELRHFVEHGYPGDSSIGMPDFEDEPPFDSIYFNHIGDDLRQSEFEARLDHVADYVYLSTASKCSVFFDECRKLESNIEHFSLRTFGICATGPGSLNMGDFAVNRVAHGLINRWSQGDPGTGFAPLAAAEHVCAKSQLNQGDVIEAVTKLANTMLDGQFEAIAKGAKNVASRRSSDRQANLAAYLDGILGCPRYRRDASHVEPESCLELEELVGNTAHVVGDALVSSVLEMVSGNKMRLHDCERTATACGTILDGLRQQLDRATSQCEQQLTEQMQQIAATTTDVSRAKSAELQRFEAMLENYCQLRFQEFAMRHAKGYYRAVSHAVESMQGMLKRFRDQLSQLGSEFEGVEELEEFEPSKIENELRMDLLLSESIDQQICQHIQKAETQVYESVIKERGGYFNVLCEPTVMMNQLQAGIRLAAQQVLADAYKKVSLENVIKDNNIGLEQLVKWLRERICDARPQVKDCGGASRMLIGLPALSRDSVLPELIEQQFNLKACTLKGTQGNFVVCFEGENVSLANVAYQLLAARPDAIELVKRIHTRNDVDWTTLDDLL